MDEHESSTEQSSVCANRSQVEEEQGAHSRRSLPYGGNLTPKKSQNAIQPPKTDQELLDHMKSEVRRLYGEKVNLVNTNFIIKPQEFRGIAKALAGALEMKDRKIETVDDLIYAVDCLCNRKEEKTNEKQPEEEQAAAKEARVGIRFVTGELQRLFSSSGPRSGNARSSSLSDDVAELVDVKNRFEKALEETKSANFESLLLERERTKETLEQVCEILSIPPGEEVLAGLKRIRAQERGRYAEEMKLKEKSLEYQKRYFEEQTSKMMERISELQGENRMLKRTIQERVASTEEVVQKSQTLEESISQIKRILVEEEEKIEKERAEYTEIKKSLLEQNRKMTRVVQDLVQRIKTEKKEKESLVEVQKTI